jgi:hypothetical protein
LWVEKRQQILRRLRSDPHGFNEGSEILIEKSEAKHPVSRPKRSPHIMKNPWGQDLVRTKARTVLSFSRFQPFPRLFPSESGCLDRTSAAAEYKMLTMPEAQRSPPGEQGWGSSRACCQHLMSAVEKFFSGFFQYVLPLFFVIKYSGSPEQIR